MFMRCALFLFVDTTSGDAIISACEKEMRFKISRSVEWKYLSSQVDYHRKIRNA